MSKIINFNEAKQKEERLSEDTKRYAVPTLEEVAILDVLNKQIDNNDMVPINIWNGSCWKAFFEKVAVPVSKEMQLDPWDVFAVFMAKFNGTEFIKDEENGNIEVRMNGRDEP